MKFKKLGKNPLTNISTKEQLSRKIRAEPYFNDSVLPLLLVTEKFDLF